LNDYWLAVPMKLHSLRFMKPIRSAITLLLGLALTGALAHAAKTVTVEANDQMKFSVNKIEAVAGSELTIKLVNVGSMPKAAMGHNLVVLKKGVDATAYSQAAMGAKDSDYLPPALADQVLVATKLIGPKEEDSITFTVPSEPGDYPYICSFPAHFMVGMKGLLVVTAE
jgi:azurin